MTEAAAIEFDRVTLTRGPRVILREASLRVPAGKVTAVIGPSGAGKSTLLHAVTGELEPSAGRRAAYPFPYRSALNAAFPGTVKGKFSRT